MEAEASHRSRRYEVALPVVYSAGPTRAGTGWARDLSETGACLELPEPLPPTTMVCVAVESGKDCLALTGTVMWIAAAGPGHYMHGLVFALLPQEQRDGLQVLLDRVRAGRARVLRTPASLPAQCESTSGDRTAVRGWTTDVGHAGVSLLLPSRFPAGALLEIVVETPAGPVAIEATAVWVEGDPTGRGQLVQHGLRLTSHPAIGGWLDGIVKEQ